MRHQLPVYSPLRLGSILAAAFEATLHGRLELELLADELNERFESTGVLLTASGTHALQVALSQVSNRRGGDPVVALPGYSCFDVVSAAVGARASLRFYDVDPTTLTPDLESVRSVVDGGVDALVAGNLYGYPLPGEALKAECDRAGVLLIEDAAQGVGADGTVGGNWASYSILSFGRGKGWTGGGGGALLTKGPATEAGFPPQALQTSGTSNARTFVVSLAAWLLGRPGLYAMPQSVPGLGLGETRYRDPTMPRPMGAFSAALARRTATDSSQAIEERRQVATRWRDALSVRDGPQAVLAPCVPVGGWRAAAFLRLPAVAATKEVARSICSSGRRFGVAPGYPSPLHRLPAVAALHPNDAELPGCERLSQMLITLPTHAYVSHADIAGLTDLVGFYRSD